MVQRRAGADRVAGLPAGAQEHEEEAAQHERRLDRAEEDPGAEQQRAAGSRPRARGRGGRSISPGSAGSRPSASAGQDLGAEVDREDLQHGQRQRDRAAGEREDEERHDLAASAWAKM